MSETPERRQQTGQTSGPKARGGRAGAAAEKSAAGPAATPVPRPLRLTAAAAIAALEGLTVAFWGVAMCFSGGDNAVLAGLLLLVFAALPLAAANGLRAVRRWSRGPALIMQLLSLPVAWTMLHSDIAAVIAGGAVLGALALTALVLLVHPATTDALGINRTASS